MQRRGLLKSLGLITGGLVLPKEILAKETPKNKSIRIAHITDTHIQPHIGAAKGFEKCLHHIQNSAQKVDFVINGGDAIMYCYLGLTFGDFASGALSQVLKSRKKAVLIYLTLVSFLVIYFLYFYIVTKRLALR